MSLGDLGAFLGVREQRHLADGNPGLAEQRHRVCGGLLEKDPEGGKERYRRSQTRQDAKALPERIRGRGSRLITWAMTRGGQVILQDVSFRGRSRGETLGIMGMTGTGKTTIVSLLQRFYDVTAGRILLDGTGYPDDSACHSCVRRCVCRDAGGIPVLGFSQRKCKDRKTGRHGSGEWSGGHRMRLGLRILSRISQNGMRQ